MSEVPPAIVGTSPILIATGKTRVYTATWLVCIPACIEHGTAGAAYRIGRLFCCPLWEIGPLTGPEDGFPVQGVGLPDFDSDNWVR